MCSREATELCATNFMMLLKKKTLFLYAEVRYGSCISCGLHLSEMRKKKTTRSYEKMFKI